MTTKKVIVTTYDPIWADCFQQIKTELVAAAGDMILSVEHVGSTSVPGLAAKPIIDLDVIIESRAVLPELIQRLAAIGYTHEGNLGIPDREAFRYESKPHLMRHHLYVCPEDSRELRRHLVFRDYLCSQPDAVEEYGRVKMEAAALYPDDIEGYIRHKSPVIESIYRLCGLEE